MSEESQSASTNEDRKKRSTGRLAMAFVQDTTVAGEDALEFVVPSGQPEFASQAEVKAYIKSLIENDVYEAEFDTRKVAVVRIVTDPQEVKVERTTKVTFS